MSKSDMIIATLSLLGEGRAFPSDKNFLYESFFELSKKFPEIFNELIFDESKVYLKCETIDIAFARIINNRMVEWRDLAADNFIILPSLVKRGRELMMSFSTADVIQLNKAAKVFSGMAGQNKSSEKNCSGEKCCGRC